MLNPGSVEPVVFNSELSDDGKMLTLHLAAFYNESCLSQSHRYNYQVQTSQQEILRFSTETNLSKRIELGENIVAQYDYNNSRLIRQETWLNQDFDSTIVIDQIQFEYESIH